MTKTAAELNEAMMRTTNYEKYPEEIENLALIKDN